MTKSTVTRLFFAGIAAFVAGFVLALVGSVTALASGAITIGGPAILTIDGPGLGSALVILVVAGVVMGTSMLVGLIAWIGALVNTFQLEDKTWFLVLLVLGLWSFGFVAMVAYVVAGPDGMRPPVSPVTAAPTAAT